MANKSMFSVVDEQADFIVINKSPDCNFHDEGDLAGGLFNQVKTTRNLAELYPVHRLDKMTSGLLIFAKNKMAATAFQELFSLHQVEKYYLAISDQKPKKKQGLIKGDMLKSRRGMWKLLRTSENPAISQFFSYSLGNKLRLYLVKPHSGRTHQIRVALSSIGAQILGDNLYSKSRADRGYLHAYAIKFSLLGNSYQYVQPPNAGEHFQLTSLAEKLVDELAEPWLLNWPPLK